MVDSGNIKYMRGYKYQLHETYITHVPIFPMENINHDFISLTRLGLMVIKEGYAWDGCSGPTSDDNTNQRAGLKHDAFAQLCREGLLDIKWLPDINKEFYNDILKDSEVVVSRMGIFSRTVLGLAYKARAWVYYQGVNAFAKSSFVPQPEEILTAP